MDKQNYFRPDILTTIANLSNDEVFTPPIVANQLLDILPKHIWSDPKVKILDPFTKTGVFLRESVKRLMEGLKDVIKDPKERQRHILDNMIYGIGITEITAATARRTVYTTKKEKRNIVFNDINHNWNKKGKCTSCGVSKEAFDREGLEKHAYEFIHTPINEIFKNMKFDVIIGNPPYQLNVENSSAKPIYNLFIEQAIAADPRYIAMIVPSRWMTGGKGLDKFREKMLKNTQFSKLYDYEDAQECFPDVSVAGGINYFLWDKYHDGPCDISYYSNDNVQKTTRFLKDPNSSVYIREYEGISILNKVKNGKFKPFDVNVLGQTPYGISTTFSDFCEEGSKNAIELYVTGTRIPKYIDRTIITKNEHFIDKHKVNVSKANGAASINGNILSKPFYGAPGSACSQTYLAIGPFDTKEEADNTISYIKTKFFRFLVSIKKKTPNANRNVYELVPMHDMKMVWTDKMLYKEYNLDVNEIEFIEDSIAEMAN